MTSSPVITLKKLARHAGLAVSTVSYALHDSPQVSPETRRRVQDIARELGYRPNPRVASLMAHIRDGKSGTLRETLAFVWMDYTRQECQRDHFPKLLISGARNRAELAGYRIDEFWLSDPGMTPGRLRIILENRRINGVLFSPSTIHQTVDLGWDMGTVAVAVIGNATWTPDLHHATHNHFLGMKNTLAELVKRGIRRPLAVIDPSINERSFRAYEAAFITYAPQKRAAAFLHLSQGPHMENAGALATQLRADAVITSSSSLLGKDQILALKKDRRLLVISLSLIPSDVTRCDGGIDQFPDEIASKAVDIVVSQLNHNERGTPSMPFIMSLPGKWSWVPENPSASPGGTPAGLSGDYARAAR